MMNTTASAPKYQTNELSCVRPPGFQDQTFHILNHPDTGFSIVIGRSRITREETLAALAQRLLQEMESSLSEFELILSQGGTIAGVPGHAIEYRWQQEGKPLQQIQILFLHQDEQGEPLSIQITGTSSNPQGMIDAQRQRFWQFISSVQLRRDYAA